MTAPTLVGPLLQIFFTDHLIAQRRLSLQTVASYRDTFRLLLQFVHRETGIEPAVLGVSRLDAEIILRFLDALEKDRKNSVASRNLRLTAIRSFYRMVALRDPASVGVATRVLAIPLKRASTRVREYLTREEMEAILASIDRTRWCGRRDYALLLTMYNLGARVSEISGLRQSHVAFGSKSYVQLHGKGRKDRSIPLWPRTAQILKDLFRELGQSEQAMAFPSIRGEPLTRFAIHLLLRKAVDRASARCATLKKKRVSPHIVRQLWPCFSLASTSPPETEAEAVAFVVCQSVGLQNGTASQDYIQLWHGDANLLRESLEAVQQTAAVILGGIARISANLRQDSFPVGGNPSRRKSASPELERLASHKPTSHC